MQCSEPTGAESSAARELSCSCVTATATATATALLARDKRLLITITDKELSVLDGLASCSPPHVYVHSYSGVTVDGSTRSALRLLLT